MKKYVFLTSVLALAACGGGSGGGGSVAPVTPGDTTVTVPSELMGRVTATDNNAVTAMKSEVIVSSNSNVELARTGHSYTDANGVVFKSYRLEDIKLYAADSVHTDDGYLQIGMDDNGRIENIEMNVGGVGAPVARVGSSTKFNAPIFEYVQDSYAKVGNNEYFVQAGLEYLKADLASRLNFSGGDWELQPNAKLKYKIGSEYASNDSGEYEVGNNIAALQEAIKDACHFDDGKWVENGGYYKYIEYGDQAVFRTVDAQSMDNLTDLESEHNLTGGHWNRVDEIMDVVTYGRDIGNGQSLQYADFGHFNPVYKTKQIDLTGKTGDDWNSEMAKDPRDTDEVNELLNKEDYQLFAGGYAIEGTTLKDDSLDVPVNTTFKGKAIGRVYISVEGGNDTLEHKHAVLNSYGIPYDSEATLNDLQENEVGRDIAKNYETNDATLTVDANGKQTLVMPFNTKAVGDKYYDVKLVKNTDGTVTPEFTGNADLIGAQYRLYNALDNVVENESSLNMGYYGVNTATEAAGTARMYSEEKPGGGVKREYEIQAAYGMKKQ